MALWYDIYYPANTTCLFLPAFFVDNGNDGQVILGRSNPTKYDQIYKESKDHVDPSAILTAP